LTTATVLDIRVAARHFKVISPTRRWRLNNARLFDRGMLRADLARYRYLDYHSQVWAIVALGHECRIEECMPAQVQLSDDDVTFLLTLLRTATMPVTTQQLIDALRNRVRS
jgi:hypothetical protein